MSLVCQFDTDGDGNCAMAACPACHPENMPLPKPGGTVVHNEDGSDSGLRILPGSVPPEIGTPHAEAHNASGLEPHDHLHGTGPGQHTHAGWTPDRVIERMKRDGLCGTRTDTGVCMALAERCEAHRG